MSTGTSVWRGGVLHALLYMYFTSSQDISEMDTGSLPPMNFTHMGPVWYQHEVFLLSVQIQPFERNSLWMPSFLSRHRSCMIPQAVSCLLGRSTLTVQKGLVQCLPHGRMWNNSTRASWAQDIPYKTSLAVTLYTQRSPAELQELPNTNQQPENKARDPPSFSNKH